MVNHSEAIQVELLLVEQSQADTLALNGRYGRDPDINLLVIEGKVDPSILG